MSDQEKLIKTLNKVGDEVEKEMSEYGLNDEEIQLIETAIVTMKQKLFEKLKRF